MLFNPRESIDFNGNTGPFIQYTYARICSVLRKNADFTPVDYSGVTPDDKETALIQQLADFPQVVADAGRDYAPSAIANYAYALVKAYNAFYHDHGILHEPDAAVRSLRLELSRVTARTVRAAMDLLGIRVPDRM